MLIVELEKKKDKEVLEKGEEIERLWRVGGGRGFDNGGDKEKEDGKKRKSEGKESGDE